MVETAPRAVMARVAVMTVVAGMAVGDTGLAEGEAEARMAKEGQKVAGAAWGVSMVVQVGRGAALVGSVGAVTAAVMAATQIGDRNPCNLSPPRTQRSQRRPLRHHTGDHWQTGMCLCTTVEVELAAGEEAAVRQAGMVAVAVDRQGVDCSHPGEPVEAEAERMVAGMAETKAVERMAWAAELEVVIWVGWMEEAQVAARALAESPGGSVAVWLGAAWGMELGCM